MSQPVRPLALTMGEPAGIGGEIALKAWAAEHRTLPPFFVIDDPARLRALNRAVGLEVTVVTIDRPADALNRFGAGLPVLPLALGAAAVPGRLDPANAAAVIEAIRRAVALAQADQIGALVTNPIQKSVLTEAGFAHPGHTEFLAELAGPGTRSIMMLACQGLRVIPVTVHLPLARAIQTLTTELIVEAGQVTADGLRRLFRIERPRLAVAALNPHAGESGTMGTEEIEIILPAVERLRALGIDASGPLPADTLFHEAARARAEAVLCMYHDQALIPLKTVDFYGGVNVTLGLPFIRTSPDHGTALDIAGTGKADPSSLIAALRLAGDLASRRDS